jgi:hypothetical protein
MKDAVCGLLTKLIKGKLTERWMEAVGLMALPGALFVESLNRVTAYSPAEAVSVTLTAQSLAKCC